LLIVTSSGVIHISDAQNAEDSLDYDCRCGKTLGHRGCSHHHSASTGPEEPSDYFSRGEHERERYWFKGGLKLCKKCGSPEDFDAAVDKYRAEWRKYEEEQDAEERRRWGIREELYAEVERFLEGLAQNQLKEFSCRVEEGKLKFQAGEIRFLLKTENICLLVEERASTECASDAPASTECAEACDA
jgi:hypothetical protein